MMFMTMTAKRCSLWQSDVAWIEAMDRQLNHLPSHDHDAVKDKDLAGTFHV
jgi:hypothetical protein